MGCEGCAELVGVQSRSCVMGRGVPVSPGEGADILGKHVEWASS